MSTRQKFPTPKDILDLKKRDKKRFLGESDPTLLDSDKAKYISDRGQARRKMNIKTGENTTLQPYRKLNLKDLFKKDKK